MEGGENGFQYLQCQLGHRHHRKTPTASGPRNDRTLLGNQRRYRPTSPCHRAIAAAGQMFHRTGGCRRTTEVAAHERDVVVEVRIVPRGCGSIRVRPAGPYSGNQRRKCNSRIEKNWSTFHRPAYPYIMRRSFPKQFLRKEGFRLDFLQKYPSFLSYIKQSLGIFFNLLR